jgi:hypothetical protein
MSWSEDQQERTELSRAERQSQKTSNSLRQSKPRKAVRFASLCHCTVSVKLAELAVPFAWSFAVTTIG